MKTALSALSLIAVALIAEAPLAAGETAPAPSPEQAEVTAAVDAFFTAIASDDKTALARHMIPEATIFIHNRMDPANPRVDVVGVARHLENWARRTASFDEEMAITDIRVDGDMAHVWGPYSFWADYELKHCGINSLSLVKGADGWKVANTSFIMERPSECERLGVPGFPADVARDGGAE
jgi:ketosteroid isomerase-like protein